jgi:hypothetical protein
MAMAINATKVSVEIPGDPTEYDGGEFLLPFCDGAAPGIDDSPPSSLQVSGSLVRRSLASPVAGKTGRPGQARFHGHSLGLPPTPKQKG